MAQQLSSKKAYFDQLIQTQSHMQSKFEDCISETTSRIENDIQIGNVNIPRKSKKQKELLKAKLQRNNKDIESIHQEIMKNQEMFKKAKKQMLLQKKMENQNQKKQSQEKKKQYEEKVKKWADSKKELQYRHEYHEKLRQEKQIQEEERKKRQQQERLQFQRKQRKKIIEKKLKQIQQNREKRQELYRYSSLETKNLNPKYLQMEKKYKQLTNELKFEQQIMKKNHKIEMQLDHEGIKQHQKAFLDRLEARQSRKPRNKSENSDDEGKRQREFNPFFLKDEDRTLEELQKQKRRLKYAKKAQKNHPVIVDESKKVKVEVQIDRGKNPQKYNFLGQKSLNDFQIYGQFQNFQLNLNPREIGKQYLKQLPTINQNSRVQKSRSTNTLIDNENTRKSRYIDYLQQLKTHRTTSTTKTDKQIEGFLTQHKKKEKVLSEMDVKVKRYELQAKKKLEEKQKYTGFKSNMKKTKQIDDIYLKSIKAKLACLQMNI